MHVPVKHTEWVCEAGQAWPMGSSCLTWGRRKGVNFAVYSQHASGISVCLYDPQGQVEIARIPLPLCTNGIWHGFVAGLRVGQLYGLRAFGPYAPRQGHRFNPAKLLLDPFARAIQGDTHDLSLELDYLGLRARHIEPWGLQPSPLDNAARMPKACVLDLDFERRAGAAITPSPQFPFAKTILYEAHVKGLTQRHPDVPAALRGTYAGLVSAPMLAHYRRLGVTTICLLPVQLFISEVHLLEKGLRNYWGYNTLGYFIPEPRYACGHYGDARAEFRNMVDQLHRHGFEVVLDVVFNHSAESDVFGPTLSWRGLDNISWYALDGEAQYLNFSGCGNSFNLQQPCAMQMVMDSLRWWVQAFGVDGFRFDLATVLGRDRQLGYQYHPTTGLLSAIGQDPVLCRVKLLAEPWDMGPSGYQLGNFPPRWHEWNDRFRDASRAFWLGFESTRGEFACRFSGSSDYFARNGRSPLASINIITAHDGMTLADITSYRDKHNAPNGEGNQDGHNHNLSANAGREGATQDLAVLAVRGQWRRALLATLFCAQGVPQLLAGDEMGHSQQGNNNAYCQDNETTWLDWERADPAQVDFVAGLIHLRQAHAALGYARWFTGAGASTEGCAGHGRDGSPDIAWRNPDGTVLCGSAWNDPQLRSFSCLIEVAGEGTLATERWLLMFHADTKGVSFELPPGDWLCALDSAAGRVVPQAEWTRIKPEHASVTLSLPAVLGWVQPLLPIRHSP